MVEHSDERDLAACESYAEMGYPVRPVAVALALGDGLLLALAVGGALPSGKTPSEAAADAVRVYLDARTRDDVGAAPQKTEASGPGGTRAPSSGGTSMSRRRRRPAPERPGCPGARRTGPAR